MPASVSTYLRFLLGPFMGLLLGLAAMASHSATINFELLPDNSGPVDDLHLPLDYVFQDGRTGLSFGFDTDGDKAFQKGQRYLMDVQIAPKSNPKGTRPSQIPSVMDRASKIGRYFKMFQNRSQT